MKFLVIQLIDGFECILFSDKIKNIKINTELNTIYFYYIDGSNHTTNNITNIDEVLELLTEFIIN